MSNFILKLFLCLLDWIKLALKFKDFPAPTSIFKDFQGLSSNISNMRCSVSSPDETPRRELKIRRAAEYF